MMKRFLRDNSVLKLEFPCTDSSVFQPVLNHLQSSSMQHGALNDVMVTDYNLFLQMSSRLFNFVKKQWFDSEWIRTVRKLRQFSLSKLEHDCLERMYNFLYPGSNMIVSPCAMQTSVLYIADQLYGSKISRSHKSSYIVAYWCGADGNICQFSEMPLEPCPGQVINFLKHILYVNDKPHVHYLAYVQWYIAVKEDIRNDYGMMVQVFRDKHFLPMGFASFIPVQRIKGKFVKVEKVMHGQDVTIVLPRLKCLDF